MRDNFGRFIKGVNSSPFKSKRVVRDCLVCNFKFRARIRKTEPNKGKYCSKKCEGISRRGRIPWNKGTQGVMKSNSGSFTREKILGEKNNKWKGDLVGYFALHERLRRNLGKAKKCIICNSGENIDWANKSGLYLSILSDWEELCHSCHLKRDRKEIKEGNRKTASQVFKEQGRIGY